MLEEFYDPIGELFLKYRLELPWVAFLIILLIRLYQLLRRASNAKKSYTNKNRERIFYIKRPKKKLSIGDWLYLLFMGSFLFYSIYWEFYEVAAGCAAAIVSLLLNGVFNTTYTRVKIKNDAVRLNSQKVKRKNIQSVALHDNWITIHCKKGKERDLEIAYTEEAFGQVIEMMEALRAYCESYGIPVEDDFVREKDQNQMLNPPEEKSQLTKV